MQTGPVSLATVCGVLTVDFWTLCSDIAGMLLKSTGEFLDGGLQKSCNEFWESADDSTASDEIR